MAKAPSGHIVGSKCAINEVYVELIAEREIKSRRVSSSAKKVHTVFLPLGLAFCSDRRPSTVNTNFPGWGVGTCTVVSRTSAVLGYHRLDYRWHLSRCNVSERMSTPNKVGEIHALDVQRIHFEPFRVFHRIASREKYWRRWQARPDPVLTPCRPILVVRRADSHIRNSFA
jgi:hypothetical protein